MNRQLELVDAYARSGIASNLFFGLAALLTAVGLTLLSRQVRGTVNTWLAGLAAAAYVLGALANVLFQSRLCPPAIRRQNHGTTRARSRLLKSPEGMSIGVGS